MGWAKPVPDVVPVPDEVSFEWGIWPCGAPVMRWVTQASVASIQLPIIELDD